VYLKENLKRAPVNKTTIIPLTNRRFKNHFAKLQRLTKTIVREALDKGGDDGKIASDKRTHFEYSRNEDFMAETIYEAVAQALASQLNIDSSEIKPESLIADDLGADSLDAVELILALEESYNVTIDSDAENLKTVADVVTLIEQLTA
jgi:acyl carrier protein